MDIDEYRAGYEAGVASSPLFGPTEAIEYVNGSDEYRRGYDDGVAGNPFDPGEGDDETDDDAREDE